ncbi:MAG: pitrilysin family protein [Cyanobacteriota bacterium]|nr:pitrilysin family protein [Cyanobacteriota bacterium]
MNRLLPGGLPLWSLRRPGPQVVAARLWLRGGSGADPMGLRGSAQLLAGLLTRGCGDLNAEGLADIVEGCGAALRAEAGEDHLAISLKCSSRDAPSLLPLLLAMVREPQLAPGQIELERQLNLQTLNRQREDPFQLAHDQIRQQLYGLGPYGHDPLGVDRELAAIDGDHLRLRARQLGTDGAVLVICGAFSEDDLHSIDRDLELRPWRSRLPRLEPGPERSLQQPLMVLDQATEQLVLMLGWATVPLGHPDGLALRLLQVHLGVGMSSRLFVSLREARGLAYDVGCHLPARRGSAPFVWHLSTSPERAVEATEALHEEWQRLITTPLSVRELDLARAKFRGQDAMGRQTCGQIADRLALVLSHGLPEAYEQHGLEQLDSLSAEDLRTVAERHLREPVICFCGPGDALERAANRWRTLHEADSSSLSETRNVPRRKRTAR